MEQNKYVINGKKIDLVDYPWDILIILDACRYDKFKEINEKYKILEGKLKKAVSPATSTPDYLFKVFGDKEKLDIVYISGNAYINSLGIPVSIPNQKEQTNFIAKNHFERIVDVWDTGWDINLNTVHPNEINKHAFASLSIRKRKRHIIHYVQPHNPYIFYGGGPLAFSGKPQTKNLTTILYKISNILSPRVVSREMIWKIGGTLNLLPTGGRGDLWKKYGREGIIKGYTEDLKLSLKYVNKITKIFSNKKFVITSDHGEMLGENGKYGHGNISKSSILKAVPWFEINF